MVDQGIVQAIVNPISGTGGKASIARALEGMTTSRGDRVEVVFTERAGHGVELAREAVARGVRAVVAVGGDGTVNEVAGALCGTEVAFGVIPCGSGNGMARHLHIPMDTRKAIDVLNTGVVERVDYCTVNERPFFCTCGVGFDAQVSHKFANEDTRGLVTYVRTTISEYFRYRARHYRLTIDGESLEEKAFVIACCNAAQYGNNAFVAPRASMRDGQVDITVIHSFDLPSAALLGARLFTSQIERDRHVTIYRGSEIVIERDDDDVMHIDGDPVMMPARLEIRCHPSGLRVLVPDAEKFA